MSGPPKLKFAAAEWAKVSPAHFAYHVSGGEWRPYAHLIYLLTYLMRVAAGLPRAKKRLVAAGQRVLPGWIIRRLMISMPPQHGKSMFVSVYFLAWVLGMFPDTRVVFVSHEAEYASEFGRKVRDLLEEWGWLFGVRVSKRSRAAHKWNIEGHRGGMRTAGMCGSITGKSADLLVIDDPIKNQEDALSETIREKQKGFWGTTLRPRVQKNGAVILIMTRWHLDDLAGYLRRIEREGGTKWEKVSLPAIALAEDEVPEGYEEAFPDPLGRAPGEPLCHHLHPLKILQEVQKDNEDSFFWALFQGWPVAGKGGMFSADWWKRWELAELPVALGENGAWFYPDPKFRFDELIQSWDCSGGGLKRTASFVVGQTWGRIGPKRYLLDQIRDRYDLADTIAAVREMKRRWPITQTVLIEGKANGPDVVKALQNEIGGLTIVEPKGDKKLRAYSWTHRAKAGDILIPPTTACAWVADWLKEHSSFPLGATNDQVDASSQAQVHFEGEEAIDPRTMISRVSKDPSSEPDESAPDQNGKKQEQKVTAPPRAARGIDLKHLMRRRRL